MLWVETHGRTPKTGDRPLFVRYRNGLESKQPYTAKQLRWSDLGDPWDVVAVRRA